MSLKRLASLFATRALGNHNPDEQIVLFLGAGADIASGGLSFRELKRLALSHYAEDEPSAAASEELIDHRFQLLFESIDTPAERARLIEVLFRLNQELVPSDSYRMIALLAQLGAIDCIVTTNFDTMLEAAQDEMGITSIQTFGAGLARPFPLLQPQFQNPSKVPFIKMHGCISSRSVTHITAEELEKPDYEPSLLSLLRENLINAHIVFLGYSGYDPGLAKAVQTCFADGRSTLYFCNPTPPDSGAPLVSAAGGLDRFLIVETGFDGAVEAMARPVLQRPQAVSTDRVFLENLLRWRVEFVSQEYMRAHKGLSDRSDAPMVLRRRAAEQRVEQFLQSTKPLAVLVGPSGYGKSTLGVRINQLFQSKETDVLLLSANSFVSPEFEYEVLQRVEGRQLRHDSGLQALEHTLKRKSRRLVIFLDGINEFDGDIHACAQLFKSILRFCAYAPENPSIRIIASIRSESWAAFQRLVNRVDLERAMWSPEATPGSVAAIGLDRLTIHELDEALARINQQQGSNYSRQRMAPSIVTLLRDPFFLSIAAQERLDRWVITTSAASFDELMRKRIERARLARGTEQIFAALAGAALDILLRERDELDHGLVMSHFPDESVLRGLKDIGVLEDSGIRQIRFSHDRIFEFFLALGFDTASGASIHSAFDLEQALRDYKRYPRAISALHLHALMNAHRMLGAVEEVFGSAKSQPSQHEDALEFCLHFLVNLAVDQPALFAKRFREVCEECHIGARDVSDITYYLRAAAFLPHETALAVLPKVDEIAAPADALAVVARTHVSDRIAEVFLSQVGSGVDLLGDPLLGPYFSDKSIDTYRRVGRILGFASLLGPDNTHPEEYAQSRSSVLSALTATAGDGLRVEQLDKSVQFFRAGKDRYLFNATEKGIESFFTNANRSEFVPIIDRLADGGSIEVSDFDTLMPYIDSFDHDLEFQLGNFLFIISALNDFDATLATWRGIFAEIDEQTHPNVFDFLQAIIPYIYVICGKDYDGFLEEPTEHVFRSLSGIIRFHPGAMRGFSRGYLDPHDQVFEDGFNPIACYGFLAPSNFRRSMRSSDYEALDWSQVPSKVPIYDAYLREYLQRGDEVAAIRIVHALGQLCILWPREGLHALLPLLGIENKRVRRSVLRVLAEAHSRYPIETQSFLEHSGSLISDREKQDIKITDGNIGKRQFEGLQWARVLHYLFQLPDAKENAITALRIAYSADGLKAAAYAIADALGLLVQGEK